ncbi:TonB-dependent siderophore receptor [Pseudoduganella sp. GCM10020061]|uniref:TonB-dependent siderophore receptor n=1 Tax=Pseudoduganella sp. GCM10020061 TaxID=3317345 RepID=UPI0036447C7C
MPNQSLKYTALALALTQAFVAPAFAADESPAPAVPAAQAAATQTAQEVVITAQRVHTTKHATVGGFSEQPLVKTPSSIMVIDRALMDDLGIRNTTDAVKLDASISDSYNAVGYAEQFSIRGFALDNASSYRKDGIAIPADTQIPLENKERLEVLKGLAGLQAGVASPGGIVNYVVKRPTQSPLLSATVGASERGTLYGAVDAGGRFTDSRFGYRINAAGERLRSYVKGADGERQFFSAAFDWQMSPQALLQLDMDYQHKSQVTAPGYQLIGNVALPANVSPKTLLNDQPWTKPVDTDSTNLGLRFEYRFNDAWNMSLAANKHWFKRDDYTAFPYGCSQEFLWPGYCSNGDYDVYDYQSLGEKKTPAGAQAIVQGKFATGAVAHQLTAGASFYERHDVFGDYVYEFAGVSNIYKNVIVPPSGLTFDWDTVREQNTERERAVFVQDIVSLGDAYTLHAGLRHVSVKRNGVDESFTLPNVALVYAPSGLWSVYGSVAHGMEHGGYAPMETENPGLPLPPSRSHQVEIGAKASVSDILNGSVTLFQIRKGLEYTDADNFYVRNGDQTHRGIELAASGRLSLNLRYGASATALQTRQEGTGDPAIDGKRATNVPQFKSSAWLEYSVPQVQGLKVNGAWQFSGKKAFDKENLTFVPKYHVFNLGASYTTRAGGGNLTLRANVDNVFDKFYWRDVTPALGGYLLPGAPRVFRVSAQYDF